MSLPVFICGVSGALEWAPLVRAGRVRMTGTVFQGGGAACFLVTSHAGAGPIVQVLFSLS